MKQKLLLVATVLSIGMIACKKDAETTPAATTPTSTTASSDDSNISEDDALAESLFESTQGIVDEGLEQSDNPGARILKVRPGACADTDITIDSIAGTATVVYTFSGEACDDGHIRSGEIILVANRKNFRENGAVLSMTFSNYIIDGNKIDAKRVITNNATIDGTTGRNQTVKVTGAGGTGFATITKADGTSIKWEANKTRKQIEGASTRTKTDDKFEVSGTQGGTSSKGHVYSTSIDIATPVVLFAGCNKYPAISGIRKVTKGTKSFTINYGDGTCDNTIVVTDSAGKAHNITVGRTGTATPTDITSTTDVTISGADLTSAVSIVASPVTKNASGDVTSITSNTDGTKTKTVVKMKGNVEHETWTTILKADGTTKTTILEAGKTVPNAVILGKLQKDGSIRGLAVVDKMKFYVVLQPDNAFVGQAIDDLGNTIRIVGKTDGSTTEVVRNKDGAIQKGSVKQTDGTRIETKYDATGNISEIRTETAGGSVTTVDGAGKPINK